MNHPEREGVNAIGPFRYPPLVSLALAPSTRLPNRWKAGRYYVATMERVLMMSLLL